MKTSEVIKKYNTTKETLRYYKKEGLINPSKDESLHDDYQQQDIEQLEFIQSLRKMDFSIRDIKSVLNEEKSINKIIIKKQEELKYQVSRIADINKEIEKHNKRKEIRVSFEDKSDTLFISDKHIKYNNTIIPLNEIKSIKVMPACRVEWWIDFRVFFEYFIDFDINTTKYSYYFEIKNPDVYKKLFEKLQTISIEDPLNIINLYSNHIVSYVNKYFDCHYRDWAKEYYLENPRGGMKGFRTKMPSKEESISSAKYVNSLFKVEFKTIKWIIRKFKKCLEQTH